MNEVIKAIMERRSIRSYLDKDISQENIDLIVTAGLYAASARGVQPWHITVVTNADVIKTITTEVKSAILRVGVERYLAAARSDAYSVNFHNAPVFTIVSADPTITLCSTEDSSLVLGNMFLAAHSLGIGSCWINQLGCVCEDPQFRAFLDGLGVPKGYTITGSACFGYGDKPHPEAKPRKENAVNYVR